MLVEFTFEHVSLFVFVLISTCQCACASFQVMFSDMNIPCLTYMMCVVSYDFWFDVAINDLLSLSLYIYIYVITYVYIYIGICMYAHVYIVHVRGIP